MKPLCTPCKGFIPEKWPAPFIANFPVLLCPSLPFDVSNNGIHANDCSGYVYCVGDEEPICQPCKHMRATDLEIINKKIVTIRDRASTEVSSMLNTNSVFLTATQLQMKANATQKDKVSLKREREAYACTSY